MKHLLLTLCLFCAVCCFAAREVTAKNSDWLVGIARMNHSELTAEEVALKRCMAFVLHEHKAFSETLPPKSAEKWANKKIKKETEDSFRRQRIRAKMKNTYKYVANTVSEDENKAVVDVKEYLSNKHNATYRYNLEKKENGWIIVSEYGVWSDSQTIKEPTLMGKWE